MESASKSIRLFAALIGRQIIGVLEIDGVNFADRNELLQFDGAIRFCLKRFEFSVRESHVLALGDFVSPHQVGALYDDLACGTKYLITYARPAFGM